MNLIQDLRFFCLFYIVIDNWARSLDRENSQD